MSFGARLGDFHRRAAAAARACLAAERGNVAMIFALSLVPLSLAAGAGLDYARALVVRSSMSDAIDAAALAVGASPGLSTSEIQTLAQNYFNANYKVGSGFGTPVVAAPVVSGQTITLSATDQMPTSILTVVGIKTLPITASTTVAWGQTKLRVSLVLDNTGSMTQTDSSGTSKISALKTATTNLLAMLKGVAVNPKDVTIAIVPFTTAVTVGKSYKSASWLTYAPWDAVGSGYGTYKSSGGWGWWGGGGSCTPGTSGCNWVATDSSHSSWTGCVMDRNKDYDVQNTLPTTSNVATLFPAAPASLYSHSSWSLTCPTPLIGQTDVLDSTGWTNLNNTVKNMTAGGATNQTIGLAWGWMLMTPGSPVTDPGPLPANTQQVIILLSDGLNTQDRWTGDGSNQDSGTDDRMAAVCTNVKAAGITIYAVFVDLNGTQGNSTVLQNCASDGSKYFDLTNSNQIIDTFNQIGQQITNLRVSQ